MKRRGLAVLEQVAEFRKAVMALQGVGTERLDAMDPALVAWARAWLAAQEKPKALPAPFPTRRRPLKRSKWARVADKTLPRGGDAHYVLDPRLDRASQILPVKERRGRGRRPPTVREDLARFFVIAGTYRKHWGSGSWDRADETAAKATAEATANEITKKYGISVGRDEVLKFMQQLPPEDRIQLLGGAWPTVRRKLLRYRQQGVKPRARRGK